MTGGGTNGGTGDRWRRGADRLAELGGARPGVRGATYDVLSQVAPDLPRWAVEFAYGDVHSRPGLDAAQRELVILGALTALGDTGHQLAAHLSNALNAGLDATAVTEAVLQTVPYTGFPRAVTAMLVVHRVLDERGLLPDDGPAGGVR
jgi:4-carboxymuconolactone decarboxylase